VDRNLHDTNADANASYAKRRACR